MATARRARKAAPHRSQILRTRVLERGVPSLGLEATAVLVAPLSCPSPAWGRETLWNRSSRHSRCIRVARLNMCACPSACAGTTARGSHCFTSSLRGDDTEECGAAAGANEPHKSKPAPIVGSAPVKQFERPRGYADLASFGGRSGSSCA